MSRSDNKSLIDYKNSVRQLAEQGKVPTKKKKKAKRWLVEWKMALMGIHEWEAYKPYAKRGDAERVVKAQRRQRLSEYRLKDLETGKIVEVT